MSEGEFVEMRPHIDEKKSPKDVDDASDTYDTIEFLLKHVPNNNGKVGIWGISYPRVLHLGVDHRLPSGAGPRPARRRP
jgi:predicted acyl esterase